MKGVTPSLVFLIVGAVIALFIGIWVISLVNSSITLPTGTISVTNEAINFAVNNTYYPFGNQPACLIADPQPANCGVENNLVTGIANSTMQIGLGNFTNNATHIAKQSTAAYQNASYNVNYSYYEFNVPSANNAFSTARTTTWNAFVLLSVGLIVIAAAALMAYFGIKR